MAAQAAQDRDRCLCQKETAAAAYTSEEEAPEAPVGRYAQMAVPGMADTAVGSERCTMAGTCSEAQAGAQADRRFEAQAGALAGTGPRSLRTGSEDGGRERDWQRLKPGCGSPASRVAFRKIQLCRIGPCTIAQRQGPVKMRSCTKGIPRSKCRQAHWPVACDTMRR